MPTLTPGVPGQATTAKPLPKEPAATLLVLPLPTAVQLVHVSLTGTARTTLPSAYNPAIENLQGPDTAPVEENYPLRADEKEAMHARIFDNRTLCEPGSVGYGRKYACYTCTTR